MVWILQKKLLPFPRWFGYFMVLHCEDYMARCPSYGCFRYCMELYHPPLTTMGTEKECIALCRCFVYDMGWLAPFSGHFDY